MTVNYIVITERNQGCVWVGCQEHFAGFEDLWVNSSSLNIGDRLPFNHVEGKSPPQMLMTRQEKEELDALEALDEKMSNSDLDLELRAAYNKALEELSPKKDTHMTDPGDEQIEHLRSLMPTRFSSLGDLTSKELANLSDEELFHQAGEEYVTSIAMDSNQRTRND
jgi:hypothetical protein